LSSIIVSTVLPFKSSFCFFALSFFSDLSSKCPATSPAPPQATQAAKLAPPVKGAAQTPQTNPIVFQFIPNGIVI